MREKSSKKLHCCETKFWNCVFSSSFYKSKLETYNFLSIIMTTCIPLTSLFGRTIYGFMRAPDKYFSFTFVMIVMVLPRLWSHTSGLKLTWNWNLLQLKFELVGRPTRLQLPKTLQKTKDTCYKSIQWRHLWNMFSSVASIMIRLPTKIQKIPFKLQLMI